MRKLPVLAYYFYGKVKRMLTAFPKLLLGTTILITIISIVTFCETKLLYQTVEPMHFTIDLVLSDASDLSTASLEFLSGMQSTKDTFSFQVTSKDTAYQDLKDGKAVAIMLLPTRVIDSILDGTNQPVQVIFADSSALSTLLLQELTNAGATILGAAQADIYTITDLYLTLNQQEFLQKSYDAINRINLSYALSRDRLFMEKSTSVTGSFSVFTYYLASGNLLLFFLFGIFCASILQTECNSFLQRMHSLSIPAPFPVLAQWLTVFLSYIFTLCFLLIGISLLRLSDTANTFLQGFELFSITTMVTCLPVIAFFSAFVVMCYRLTPTPAIGILVLTISAFLFLFLSGGFIPSAFFPDSLKAVSPYLPSTYALYFMAALFSQLPTASYLLPLSLYTIGCLAFSTFGYGLSYKKYC